MKATTTKAIARAMYRGTASCWRTPEAKIDELIDLLDDLQISRYEDSENADDPHAAHDAELLASLRDELDAIAHPAPTDA